MALNLMLQGTMSNAGKSLLAHAVMGLLPENAPVGGLMRFDGRILDRRAQMALRGNRIALVPQSVGYLDPLATVGQQLRWAARRARQPVLLQRFSHVGNIRLGFAAVQIKQRLLQHAHFAQCFFALLPRLQQLASTDDLLMPVQNLE